MCYAIPGKVVELKGKYAVVDYFGERRMALNDLVDARIGDYAYAQGGFLVSKIPPDDAREILKTWREIFLKLQRTDTKISNISDSFNPRAMPSELRHQRCRIKVKNNKLVSIIEKAGRGLNLKKVEILELLKTKDKNELNLLYKTANILRKTHLKNSCCVHGIIEFSNFCKNDCYYCGIRESNKRLERYRMTADEIVNAAEYAVNELGFKALVLQSGEDFWYTTEKLVDIIKEIRDRCGVLLFMSIGERSFRCYERLYGAGARGVLLRFETSNPELFGKLHPKGKGLEKRIKLLRYANKLGYIIATGSLIGLPEQTEEDLMNDILLTKSLNVEMYSFGPFIPHPQTPLANSGLVDINAVLKVIAVSRLVNPSAKILVTSALETLNEENGGRLGLLSGANSLMINVTPFKYKNLYSIYPNKFGNDKGVKENIKDTLKLLYSLGRAPTDLGI